MTEPKLKPCPWCGGKVKVTNLDGNIHYGRKNWCVVCWDCEMFFGYDLTYGGIYKTKKGCAEDWTTRVSEVAE